MNCICNYINKKRSEKEERREIKRYLKARDGVLKHGVHSELIIERPDGLDRCSLIIISKDTPQLKELQESLNSRGIRVELYEDFFGGRTDFKFNLTPKYVGNKTMEEAFENRLKFLDKYFVYGKPVESIEFFTEKEKEIMRRWFRY